MTAAPDALRTVLRDAGLGAARSARPAGAGERNRVWFVDTDEEAVVVRFLASSERMTMEVAAIDRARGVGIPVPEVLWSATEPEPVMVQRRLPGLRLGDWPEPSDALASDTAEVLRRIHHLGVEGGFGNLDGDLRGSRHTLTGWFIDDVRAEAGAVLTAPQVPAHHAAAVETSLDALESARRLLDAQRPGFAHGDFHANNLLTDGERITGVLDWEAAKSGPAALDFGWWDWISTVFGNPWPTEVLLDHYDPDHRLDRDELATLRSLVVRRVWSRELIAGLRAADQQRAAAARAGLSLLVL